MRMKILYTFLIIIVIITKIAVKFLFKNYRRKPYIDATSRTSGNINTILNISPRYEYFYYSNYTKMYSKNYINANSILQ